MTHPSLRPLPLTSRIAAAILGGYLFCWGFIAFGMSCFYATGMSFHDAEHLSSILGVVSYLVVFLWVFSTQRLGRMWLFLLGGAALMAGGAELVKRSML